MRYLLSGKKISNPFEIFKNLDTQVNKLFERKVNQRLYFNENLLHRTSPITFFWDQFLANIFCLTISHRNTVPRLHI